jgi:Tfp pilus assembly protein PilF
MVSEIYSESHSEMGVIFNEIGLNLLEQKDYEAALLSFQKGLKIFKIWGGLEQFHCLSCLNNISVCLIQQDRTDEAEECLKNLIM